MENLLLSIGVVFPIILQMALGWFLQFRGLLSEPTLRELNALAFRVLLPVMMYMNIYHGGIQVFSGRLTLFAVLSVSAMFLLSFVLVPRMEKDHRKRGVLIQGIGRSNFAVFGYAVATKLCGPDQLGVVALMVAIVLPLYGVYSTIALELYTFRDKRSSLTRHILLSILRNPLVIGGVLGLLSAVIELQFPEPLVSAMDSIAQAATPISLIALGGFLDIKRLRGKWSSLWLAVTGKLVVVPLLFLPLAAFLGFHGAEFAALLAIFASPTATASFTMTQQIGGDEDLAAGIVILGALCAAFTTCFFIAVFHSCLLGR